MTRRLTALGLAMGALLALGAVGAQAEVEYFHSHVGEKNPDNLILTGEQTGNHVFTPVPGGVAFTCKKAKFSSTEEGTTHSGGALGTTVTSESITLTPSYLECEAFGVAATVTTTGCHHKWTLHLNFVLFALHFGCEAGKAIEFSAAGCTIKVGTQSPGGGLSYENNKSGSTNEWDLKAKAAVTGISFSTSGSFACALAGIPKEGTEGTYSGEMTVKGFEDLEKAGTGSYVEGKQLGIWKGPTE